jgi:hypothetical protein
MARHSADRAEENGGTEPVDSTLVYPTEGKIEYVPPHHRVINDRWIRNRIISVAGCTCLAANIVTWLTTRDVNAVLIGAGLSLLLGIPFVNLGDKRGN